MDVPRYNPQEERLRFGGKIIDGILSYPYGMEVDVVKAARIQAFLDYSYREGNVPVKNPEMVALYGEPYVQRFEALEHRCVVLGGNEHLHHICHLAEDNLEML